MMRARAPITTTRSETSGGLGRWDGGRISRCRPWLSLFGLVITLVLGMGPSSWAAPRGRSSTSTSAPEATKAFMGANYIELGPWAARYGLKLTWVEKGKRVRLESAFTQIHLEADRRELLLNDLRVFLGEPIVASGATLWIGVIDARDLLGAILRPAAINVKAPELKVICLDAGHGGNDTGTQNKALKLDEKHLTLDVAQRVKRLLEGQGYKVLMTRTDDRFIELEERAAISNRAGADLFVSIHFNSFSQPAIKGTETYILTRKTQRSTGGTKRESSDNVGLPGNAMDPWNGLLGYAMHRQLTGKLKTFDRGLKFARFKVLTLVKCPGVLIESGYLSNEAEARKIMTPAYRNEIAAGIVNGITSYATQLAASQK